MKDWVAILYGIIARGIASGDEDPLAGAGDVLRALNNIIPQDSWQQGRPRRQWRCGKAVADA